MVSPPSLLADSQRPELEYDPKNSILNALRMGKFSLDRTVREYCREIWQVQPVPIALEASSQEAAGIGRSH